MKQKLLRQLVNKKITAEQVVGLENELSNEEIMTLFDMKNNNAPGPDVHF